MTACGTCTTLVPAARKHRAEVKWGDQSWEEMLLAMVTLSIDPDTDATKIFERARRAPESDTAANVSAEP